MEEKWVRIEINSNVKNVNIKETEPREEPWLLFVCEPTSPNQQNCELTAIVPESIKEEIVRVWKEIYNEEDELEIIRKLVAVVLEVDDNPHLKLEYNRYETKIEINPA